MQINETAVTSTAAELNILDGVTASAAEINLLDGVTASTAEINFLDGVTSNIQTQLDSATGFRPVTAGGNTLGASETLAFTAGSNITITEDGGAVTIAAAADTNIFRTVEVDTNGDDSANNTLGATETLRFKRK